MGKNKKTGQKPVKGMQKLSSDNEGNNENNDDSEVIIAAVCGRRFVTMCLLLGPIVWQAFFS